MRKFGIIIFVVIFPALSWRELCFELKALEKNNYSKHLFPPEFMWLKKEQLLVLYFYILLCTEIPEIGGFVVVVVVVVCLVFRFLS